MQEPKPVIVPAERHSPTDTLETPPVSVGEWERRLHRMRDEQEALARAGLWGDAPDDLLSLLGQARHEAHHAAVLAWLLDPGAPHGLGPRFLEAFLRECELAPLPPPEQLSVCKPAREVERARSRADLVLLCAPFLTLVIEVKIDQPERPGQCDDLYADYQHEAGAAFVFLTPRGRRPRSASGAAAGAFHSLSFARLKRVLARQLADGGPWPPGHAAALTYLRTLERLSL